MVWASAIVAFGVSIPSFFANGKREVAFLRGNVPETRHAKDAAAGVGKAAMAALPTPVAA